MFDVLWDESAYTAVAGLLAAAGEEDRREILLALTHLSELLRQQADTLGESRGGNARFVSVPPFGITFEVDPDFPVVRVRRLWRVHRRSP